MQSSSQIRRGPIRPDGWYPGADDRMPDIADLYPDTNAELDTQSPIDISGSPQAQTIGRLAADIGGAAESPPPSPSPTQSQVQSPSPSQLYHTADNIPRINVPDIASMHDSPRLTDLQGQVDALQHRPSLKNRLLRAVASIAPTIVGGALGGSSGLSGAAAGSSDAFAADYQHGRDHINQLNKEIEDAQRGRDTEYQGQVHTAQAQAQMDSNAAWRDATLNQRQAGVDARTNTQQVIAGQRSHDNLLKMGLDAQGNPLPDDQLPPTMRDTILHHRAQNELIAAQTDLTKARTTGVPLQIKMAEQRLSIAKQNAATARERLDLGQRQFEASFYGTDHGTPIPGAPTDSEGNVYGPRMANAAGPTSTTRTKVQQAAAIEQVGSELIKRIRANSKLLGPVSGRVTNLEELWGNLPPEASRVAGLQGSFAALQPGLHQMRSQKAMQDFEKRLQVGSFKTNADAMEAGVQAAIDSAAIMHKAWQAPSGYQPPGGHKGGQPSAELWERGPDGKLRRKK